MFYIQQDEKIVLFDENKETLQNTLAFIPQYEGLEILETEREIITLNGRLVFADEVQEELAQKEAERIANLKLTGADVERGIYQAKGMDFEDILAFVMANPPTWFDIKALKIELKANHFYRGNPYVDAVGALLGFTSEQLDKFFETNDYTCLLEVEEPEEPVEDGETEYDIPEEVVNDNTDNIA